MDRESDRFGGSVNAGAQSFQRRFGHPSAVLAYQEHRLVPGAGMIARRKCVQAFQAVDKAVFDQKIQRAINDRRLASEAFGFQPVQDFVRPKRPVGFQQNFKNPFANRRKAQPSGAAGTGGLAQRRDPAPAMIMAGKYVLLFRVGHFPDSDIVIL